MKILYLGKFERHYRTENYVATALETLGHTVLKFPVMNPHSNLVMRAKQETSKFDPDLVLFSKSYFTGIKSYIKWLRHNNTRTACWLWDLFLGFGRRLPPQASEVEFLFSTDGGHQAEFSKRGIDHRLLRQGIHAPLSYQLPQNHYQHDVAFIGSLYTPERERLVRWLKDNYGSRFKHHTITRGADLNLAISQVKVVVGDSYPSPHYWSNRVYEVLGRGGFFLHPETVGMDTEFTDCEQYVSYRPVGSAGGFDDLRSAIDTYVSDDIERQRIATNGYALVSSRYTYLQRCESLLAAVGCA